MGGLEQENLVVEVLFMEDFCDVGSEFIFASEAEVLPDDVFHSGHQTVAEFFRDFGEVALEVGETAEITS